MSGNRIASGARWMMALAAGLIVLTVAFTL
jgi:hypothetical protein